MLIRNLASCALIMVLTIDGMMVANAEQRVALVIGNGAYHHAVALPNPPGDAAAIAKTLQSLGFGVTAGYDLNKEAQDRLVRDFGRKAAGADVAAVFYAGHGVQVNGHNYLLPVTTSLEREGDLTWEALPLDAVLNEMASVRRLRVVILDACRNNPFAERLSRGAGTARTLAATRGLARVDQVSSDTLIAYATRADDVASDGEGTHSPYTAALLKYLATPGLDLNLLMGKVRDDVRNATHGKQEPYVYGSLGGSPFYFRPANSEAPPIPAITPPASTVAAPLAPHSEPASARVFADATLTELAGDLKVALEGRHHILIRRFDPEIIPVPVAQAESLTDAMVLAMRPVAPDATFARDMVEGEADAVLQGALRPSASVLLVSYRLTDARNGQLLATTAWKPVTPPEREQQPARPLLTLDQAVTDAANQFRKTLGTIRIVRSKGILHQQSGIQTPFGRMVSERLLEKLKRDGTESRRIEPPKLEGGKGIKLRSGDVDAALVRQKGEEYLLRGSHWEAGNAIGLRLALKNAQGREVVFEALVRKASWPGNAVSVPSVTFEPLQANDDAGPLGLYLSSDKGSSPVYKIKESLNLLVQTERDAFLNCFYLAADGELTRIFPNKYHPEARIAGEFLHRIPGGTMKFELEVSGPPGGELIKCFATDQAVESRLPDALRKSDLSPLPHGSERDLTNVFRALKGTGLSEASLVITVEEK